LELAAACDQSADSLLLQAKCRHALGNLEQAAALAEQALQLAPKDAAALSFMATLAGEAGEPRKVADLLARAVRQQPRDYSLRYRLVQAYHRIGEDERAEQVGEGMEELRLAGEEYRQLLRQADRDFTDLTLRYRIASLAQTLGFTDIAQSWYRAAQMLEAGMANGPKRPAQPLAIEAPQKN
ncbi:MAG: hypothetical protein ACREJM_10850, partial [Candidatus Saccharimonadales bacterium]